MAGLRASVTGVGLAMLTAIGPQVSAQAPCGALDLDLDEREQFGREIAIEGDRVAIGAPDSLTPNGPGSVYVFRRIDDTWTLEQQLLADDGDDGDRFGDAIAISGDLIVIGARYDEPEFWTGSAYVFRFDGERWNQEQKLTASNGAELDRFGEAVAVSGNWALIGAPDTQHESQGSVYAFEFDGTQWVERHELRASDRDQQRGRAFGASLDMESDLALIGAPRDPREIDTGAVYMVRLEDGAWVERQKIVASNGKPNEKFGFDLCLDGNTAVVGVFPSPQRAHVLTFDGTMWHEHAQLTSEDVGLGDAFGSDVSIAGDLIVIGASGDDDRGENAGAAYVFRRDTETDTWHEHLKLLAHDGVESDRLSEAAVAGATAFVGAPGVGDDFEGAVYVFTGIDRDDCNANRAIDECDIFDGTSDDENGDGVPDACEPPCDGDVDGDDDADMTDLMRVVSAWGPCEGECPEDLDGNGIVGLPDLLIVLAHWGPCLPIGACCVPDGTCEIIGWVACVQADGLYRGHGTTCADCPTGACCFENGTCLDLFEAVCDAIEGGIYQGHDTSCADGCPGFLADDCADALPIGDGTVLFSTIDATSGAPFALPPECDEGQGIDFRNDVWALYTAPCDGRTTASVCNSSYDTRIAVYTPGQCPGAFVACNDDACGDDGTRSEVSFDVSAGASYLIRVGARSSGLRGLGFLVVDCDGG